MPISPRLLPPPPFPLDAHDVTHTSFFIYAPRANLLHNACTLTLPHHPPRSTLRPPNPTGPLMLALLPSTHAFCSRATAPEQRRQRNTSSLFPR